MGAIYFERNVIHEIPLMLYDAWVLEQNILKTLKEYQYFPNYKFNGQTECLKVKDVVLESISNIIFNGTCKPSNIML